MPDAKARLRVERLLRGNLNADDLAHLFLFARDHCDGRQTVKEIGNFVAHQTEREKGLVTESTREWSVTARFWFNSSGVARPEWARLPSATPEYLPLSVDRVGEKDIKKETKLTLKQARDVIAKFVSRLIKNSDGTWRAPRDTTEREALLAGYLMSIMVSAPAFEASRLVKEFMDTLKSNALLTKEEARQDGRFLSRAISAYAVSVMHNCRIVIKKGEVVALAGSADSKRGELCVIATIPDVASPSPDIPIGVGSPMFVVEGDVKDYCDSALIDVGQWQFEVELGVDGRLIAMR